MARFRALALNWGPTIVFNVVLPYLTYTVLTDRGMSTVAALAISGFWPAVEVLGIFLIRRRVDDFGVLTLIVVGLGVLSALVFRSESLALVKESAATGLFGLMLLGSLLMRRPLMFYFGRKFGTDGSAEGLARWNGLWEYAGFRRVQRVLTLVWGVVYLAEAIARIALVYVLPTSTMVLVSTVLPIVVTAALVAWTILYARRSRAAAERRLPGGRWRPCQVLPNPKGPVARAARAVVLVETLPDVLLTGVDALELGGVDADVHPAGRLSRGAERADARDGYDRADESCT